MHGFHYPHEAAKISQNGLSNSPAAMSAPPHSPQPYPRYSSQTVEPPQPPQRSRAIFDPVRGIERSADPSPSAYTPQHNATPPRAPVQRSSASPAISSLINHPESEGTALTFHSRPSTAHTSSYNNIKAAQEPNSTIIVAEKPAPPEIASAKRLVDIADKTASETESKPKRAKEKPPPVPIGSGLLNSTFFGGEGSTEKPELGKGVSVVLEIPLKRGENKIFNFAKLAEEKYGFAAVYPRQAAQKERLARVAAAGAALERSASGSKRGETSNAESADEDISEDLDKDSDNDGDVNMTGINGTNENSGTDAPAPKKRRRKDEEYDADDPFVDDSEMLWESQAVASRDGFFVYMGSLVPEPEKNAPEKTETVSKRGRGRGRGGGVGSRGGRGAASAAQVNGESTGRGSTTTRGSGIVRKPRVTKAERAQREKKKAEREAAAASLSTRPPPSVTA